MAKQDLFETVTATILEALEQGVNPWHQPWTNLGLTCPVNITTGKKYRGINTLILTCEMLRKNFSTARFLTFKQALDKGGCVRKGEKGTTVVFWKFLERQNKVSGAKETIPLCRAYTVFNVAQCDGLPEDYTKAPETLPVVAGENPEIETFIQNIRATLTHGGDRACYSKTLDSISMPEKGQFSDMAHYYSTVLHELVHWTGNENRCKRMLDGRFGNEAYAAEELVAEIGSAYLCAEFGIQGKLQHTEYIQNWIKVLKGDTRAIFRAASLAQEAFDYLMDKSGRRKPQEVQEGSGEPSEA